MGPRKESARRWATRRQRFAVGTHRAVNPGSCACCPTSLQHRSRSRVSLQLKVRKEEGIPIHGGGGGAAGTGGGSPHVPEEGLQGGGEVPIPLPALTVLHLHDAGGRHGVGGDEHVVMALDADEVFHGGGEGGARSISAPVRPGSRFRPLHDAT